MRTSPNLSNLLAKKKGAVTAAFLLVLLVAALPFSAVVNVSLGSTSNIQTSIFLDVQSNPVAIGNTVLLSMKISPLPPTLNDYFSGLTLSITRPDGTIQVRSSLFPDSNGLLQLYYTPDQIGNHRIQLTYSGQFFPSQNVTYLAAQSPVITLAVQSNVGPRTWIVDDDSAADFHTIQEAIDAALSGDTIFVHSSTYRENLVINKPLSLIGENSFQTLIVAKNSGKEITVSASRVNIVNFTIQGSGSTPSTNIGVYFGSSTSNCNVSYNILTSHGYAISLSGSSHNVNSNYIVNNGVAGIYLNGSSNNIITRNNVTGNTMAGIFIAWPSTQNVFRGNWLASNNLSLNIISYDLQGYINDIDTSNTVNGKPIYYWINRKNQTVPLDAGVVVLVNCAYMTVQDLQITSAGQGIYLAYTNNSIVQRNNITDCSNGIRVQFSINNTLTANNIHSCTIGVAIMNATSNTIRDNTITASGIQALFVFLSAENRFYHNHLDNKIQVWTDNLELWNNTWDNGYPSGGNYWSDYNGTDANHDGIGDTPYVIDANNVDRYPLILTSNVTPGNKTDNNNSSTLAPSEKNSEVQHKTDAVGNATDLTVHDGPLPKETNDSGTPPVNAELKPEPAPNLLTVIVVVGILIAPVMLTVYCVKRTHPKTLLKSQDVANG